MLLTGGGASLPGLSALASGQHTHQGIAIRHYPIATLPADLDPKLRQDFPMLAVALGGAVPEQPEVRVHNMDPRAGSSVTHSQNSWTGPATRALY